MNETWLLEGISRLIPLVLSLTVHEWAHAYSARKLGDDTAERQGRLTLNPVAHIDPIGTILMPLLSPIPFGWAKPVPFDPARFTRKLQMRTSVMIVAAAGPFANLVLALICIVTLGLLLRFEVDNEAMYVLLQHGFTLNVILALFNMLPIRPLDGSSVVDRLIPRSLRPSWDRFSQYGPIVLLALIVLPYVTGVSLFRWPVLLAWQGFGQPVLSFFAAGS